MILEAAKCSEFGRRFLQFETPEFIMSQDQPFQNSGPALILAVSFPDQASLGGIGLSWNELGQA